MWYRLAVLFLGCWLCGDVQAQSTKSTTTTLPAPVAAQPVELEPEGMDPDDSSETVMAIDKTLPEAEQLRVLFNRVNLLRRQGDYSEGLAQARQGLHRAQALHDERLQIGFLYLMGRIYWNLTDYPASVESHLAELRLAQKIDDKSLLARTHGGLGLSYQRFGRNEDALHHLDLGLQFAAEAQDVRMRGSLLNSLGNYYLGEQQYERSIALHREALAIRQSTGNRRAIAETLTNLGLAADGQGDYVTALDYLHQALTTFQALKYRRYIANTHRRLARVFRNAGRTEDALVHLNRARLISQSLESPEVLADIYQEYALTHEARGEFAKALDFQRRHARLWTEINSEQDRRRMSELRASYGQEQRELEITLLKRDQALKVAEISRRRSQTVALAAALIGGVAIFGSVIIVQLVRLRAERRMRAATENARERAEVAERLKSRMLQMASHDLKVPLSALNATARLISGAPADEATVRRLAKSIQADTERMRNLVRDFLDASAIEDGNLQLHTTELDLTAVATVAIASLLPVAAAKNQSLSLQPPLTRIPHVEADEERLRQVFDNLIGNALKFTPLGGTITIALGESGAWAFAEVRDTGPGLGPADFAKIFAPRQRLSAKPTGPNEDSSGLGLFIARELLTLQGGRLEVQSQPGRGAVFRVLLPLAAPPATTFDMASTAPFTPTKRETD